MSGEPTPRRSFLGRMVAAAAAASLPLGVPRQAAAQQSGADDWIKEVKGSYRLMVHFPQHKNMMPQLHILNFLNTYAEAYKVGAGQAGAVGTFYSLGTQSSIALGFNDAMWTKYRLSAYLGLKDSKGAFFTRNVFNMRSKEHLSLVFAPI